MEDIGVEVHDVSVDGILSGRLKCILGLFFNLSKFKQKLRECQSHPKSVAQSGIPQKSADSPLTSTSLDSPDSDRRYVTPPSSVQSSVQHQARPLSDPQALKKPIDSKSRLPVFRQNRTKNCLSDSPQPKSGELAASSLPTRSIRSPQPIKNQKNLPSKAPNSSLGSPSTNPPMFPISRPGGGMMKHPSSLPHPASIQTRSLVDFGGSRPLREISGEPPMQQPISKSTVVNNAISPPLFTKPHIQYYPPSNYPGVSQLPAPTLSFNAGVLRFNRPSDFLPQSLTPTASSKSSSFASLSSSSNGGHPLPNNLKMLHNENENVNGEKDDEGEGEESPLGSGEINRAMSQLEDVNPGTWSGRLPPTLPGMSTSNGHFYLTTSRQRASLDPHLHNDKISASVNHNDGDNKSIKSECLPGKDMNRPAKRLGIPPTLYSSESNLFTPDTWSNSLPNRPFHRVTEVTTMESPSTLAQLRARADGREEVTSERIYGPLGFLKLPYDPPRSHIDHGEAKSPYSVVGCTNMKQSDDGTGSEAEICHLRRELESARQKVTTLTSQLELNFSCQMGGSEMMKQIQMLTEKPFSQVHPNPCAHSSPFKGEDGLEQVIVGGVEATSTLATFLFIAAVHNMDRLYPNFYSLHATPVEPLEVRFKRRSWNAFPENPPLPYTVYTSVQETTLQSHRHQRCSSEAPTSRRVSTFLPDNSNIDDEEVDDGAGEDGVEETTNSISPIPPIAVVKPTVGRMDGRRIHRPQPCYGLSALPSLSNDLLPPYMQMSTPEVYFNTHGPSNFKQPTVSLPRRRTQLRRERTLPAARHSVFEYPNVVDYGPLQNAVMQDLTLRRRSRRHPEASATAPLSRRRPCGSSAAIVPLTSRPSIAIEVEQLSTPLTMPKPQPPLCGRMERQGRSTRACLVSNFEQSLANMAQRLQSLTVSAAEKDSELRELRQIIDSMVQERSSSNAVDPTSGKPPFPPSATASTNANSPGVAAGDKVEVEEEKSNSCPPGTPKSSGIRKGGWLRSSFDRAFRRRGSQTSLTGDASSHGSHSKPSRPLPVSAWNSPDHRSSHTDLRKNFVRAASVSADVSRTQGYPGNHLGNGGCIGVDGSRVGPTSPPSISSSACCEAHSRCRLLEAEVEALRKELGERERRLTDAQLQALASAHQVDQLRDQLNLLFQQLSLLRSDNERLHASAAAAANSPHFSAE
ncbi:unnamed protein product [Hydatigera taeniaeformis]|uniref:Protein kinase domain-containing protein n=1 Tax=Hydatigena taeniaeformis TaxID=6205 RepID=A0A0R3X517_HYDTA|nr:unnamed protein product [Hydatigera taeniaeformis]